MTDVMITGEAAAVVCGVLLVLASSAGLTLGAGSFVFGVLLIWAGTLA